MTDRQREFLEFFRAFTRREGLPPTIREVAGHFNVGPRSALDVILRLVAAGALRLREGDNRAHRVVLAQDPLQELRERIQREDAGVTKSALDMRNRILTLVDEELAR